MYFVYIIQSEATTNFIYKGLTDNLERRLDQHNSGRSSATRSFKPFKLIHVEICDSRVEARKMEKFFKSGFGREIIQELIASTQNSEIQ